MAALAGVGLAALLTGLLEASLNFCCIDWTCDAALLAVPPLAAVDVGTPTLVRADIAEEVVGLTVAVVLTTEGKALFVMPALAVVVAVGRPEMALTVGLILVPAGDLNLTEGMDEEEVDGAGVFAPVPSLFSREVVGNGLVMDAVTVVEGWVWGLPTGG